jgi:hypothetical protein
MRPNLMQAYMSIGSLLGLVRAAPELYAVFQGHPVPDDPAQTRSLAIAVLYAVLHGLVRAIAWLPSLVYNVGMHHESITTWLFTGWW